MRSPQDLFIGIMSGTSLDGIDTVLIRYEARNRVALLATHHQDFPATLKQSLHTLNTPGDNEAECIALAANQLAQGYADSVAHLLHQAGLTAHAIRAIGCHGQTIRHRPDLGYTVQIGNAALLAELTGICVVSDFRSRDIAAAGQGAPLVPAFHQAVFSSPETNRAIVNIGGISNISYLSTCGAVSGFDCGPGNVLLDGWIQQQRQLPFDHNGAWGATGQIIPNLLTTLLQHPFLQKPPPKSTGRDDFHLPWLLSCLCKTYQAVDVQATLLEYSALCITRALTTCYPDTGAVYLCGGGAHNLVLVERLAALLPQPVATTSQLGISADWVEASAFAWLASQTLAHQPGNVPEVTGAKGTRVLGAIYPA